jgi:GT2 family glycosyltransferase
VRIGVVAIGRNEGERLISCLASARAGATTVVYVDSGSTDASVRVARELGAHVVELDMSIPFTAARARNAGFERLLSLDPSIELVQFVDGDCEIVEGWLERASSALSAKPQAAVVCGRRRERFPNTSRYNRLCDIEWNTPVGTAKACGGDAMVRVSAFREVGGYDASVIAGEEPEMCVRLRAAGWTIERIDAEMTLHDAAMFHFAQWWKRSLRAGHAYAEGYAMHGAPPERHRAKEHKSILFWGLGIPLIVIVAQLILSMTYPRLTWVGVLPLLGYPLLYAKITMRRTHDLGLRDASLYASSVVIGKFPQMLGVLKYWSGRWSGKKSAVIEYKQPAIAAK